MSFILRHTLFAMHIDHTIKRRVMPLAMGSDQTKAFHATARWSCRKTGYKGTHQSGASPVPQTYLDVSHKASGWCSVMFAMIPTSRFCYPAIQGNYGSCVVQPTGPTTKQTLTSRAPVCCIKKQRRRDYRLPGILVSWLPHPNCTPASSVLITVCTTEQ